MSTVGIYLLYLLIGVGLTAVVGTGLARSGSALLQDVFGGNDMLARAVSRLIVLGFYLLSLGFITLTMRAGGAVSSAGAGLQLLSAKVGEMLLVLGALHLLTMAALIRARRLAQARLTQPELARPARSGGTPHTLGRDARTGAASERDDPAAPKPDPGTASSPLAGSVLQ